MFYETRQSASGLDATAATSGAGAGGDQEQWWRLTRELRPRLTRSVDVVLRAILRRSENPGYAEDIVNDALAAAFARRDTYDPARGRLDAWLLRIARNKALDFLRRNRDLKSEFSFDDSVAHTRHPASEAELLYEPGAEPSARTQALRQALKRLRPYDQEILICRFGNALDYEEMERYFDFAVKKDTLRVHVKRARDRLRRELRKEPAFEEWLAHG